jgi:hypothetical protein
MNCRNLSQFEEKRMPITTDNIAMINNFNLKEMFLFSVIFEDIQTLIVTKRKKTAAAIANNLILEKRVIRKICSKD